MYRIYLRADLKEMTEDSAKSNAEGLDKYLKLTYNTNTQLGYSEEINMYRIFIDIPFDANTPEDAIIKGKVIMDLFLNEDKFTDDISNLGVVRLNYRLGNDEDRQKSNYFIIDEKDHVSTKKSIIELIKSVDESSDM